MATYLRIKPARGEFYFASENVVKFHAKLTAVYPINGTPTSNSFTIYKGTTELTPLIGGQLTRQSSSWYYYPTPQSDSSRGSASWLLDLKKTVARADLESLGLTNTPTGEAFDADQYYDFPITYQGISFNVNSVDSGLRVSMVDDCVVSPSDGAVFVDGTGENDNLRWFEYPVLDAFTVQIYSAEWNNSYVAPWSSYYVQNNREYGLTRTDKAVFVCSFSSTVLTSYRVRAEGYVRYAGEIDGVSFNQNYRKYFHNDQSNPYVENQSFARMALATS